MTWVWLRSLQAESGAFVDLDSREVVEQWSNSSLLGGGLNEHGLVCWSGSLAELDPAQSEPEDHDPADASAKLARERLPALWKSHPLTWSARGWAELERRLQSLPGNLVLRTHARHVLSDLPGIVRVLKIAAEFPTSPRVQVLIDPASMLTPSMFASGPRDAMDCVRRVLEWCAEHVSNPAVWGVIVSNVRARVDVPGLCEPCSLSDSGTGVGGVGGVGGAGGASPALLNADALADVFAEHLPRGTRRVLVGAEPERQRVQVEQAARGVR